MGFLRLFTAFRREIFSCARNGLPIPPLPFPQERITYQETALSQYLPDLDSLDLPSPPFWHEVHYPDRSTMRQRVSAVGTECGHLVVTLADVSFEGVRVARRWTGEVGMGPINAARGGRKEGDRHGQKELSSCNQRATLLSNFEK